MRTGDCRIWPNGSARRSRPRWTRRPWNQGSGQARGTGISTKSSPWLLAEFWACLPWLAGQGRRPVVAGKLLPRKVFRAANALTSLSGIRVRGDVASPAGRPLVLIRHVRQDERYQASGNEGGLTSLEVGNTHIKNPPGPSTGAPGDARAMPLQPPPCRDNPCGCPDVPADLALGAHKARPYNPTWDTAVIRVAWDGPAGDAARGSRPRLAARIIQRRNNRPPIWTDRCQWAPM